MTKRAKRKPRGKGMTRRRQISQAAARRVAGVKLRKKGRKQAVRQAGRRRGGR
jgi:hypothetical protein